MGAGGTVRGEAALPRRQSGRRRETHARDRASRRTGSGRNESRTRRSKGDRAVKETRGAVMGTQLAYFVLIPTVALLLLGLVMVFSAGSVYGLGQSGSGYRLFTQQVIWACIGLGLLVFFAKFDYHKLGKLSWIGVLVSTGLLVAVLFVGRVAGGSRRWLMVGPVNLQPTEIAKFCMVVFAAYTLATKGEKLKKFVHLLVPVMVATAVMAALILQQPDLGSAIVLCSAVMVVAVLSQARLRHLAVIGLVGGGAAAYFMFSAPYRMSRLFSFVNPWKSPKGYGYQVIQSYIALGSGNIKGLGLGMSRQKYFYLPNAHTDFIFAVIGEELGIAGTCAVVALFGLFAYGGFRIAQRAGDELGKLLAAGITGLILIQAIVNMGGVTGLLPITGVPLPLVSAGGSSLCICMGCIGILLNIAKQS